LYCRPLDPSCQGRYATQSPVWRQRGGRLLADFDDGRSKSFYCRSAALLDLAALESALDAAARKIETGRIPPDDAKTRARILLALLAAE
jgi:hypothetical protein